ncbi:MAG: hypothetical protein J5995_02380 [Muribaculaceae bacterium]|nr:hypothetical protein [Muribaculaceae bacterium]
MATEYDRRIPSADGRDTSVCLISSLHPTINIIGISNAIKNRIGVLMPKMAL